MNHLFLDMVSNWFQRDPTSHDTRLGRSHLGSAHFTKLKGPERSGGDVSMSRHGMRPGNSHPVTVWRDPGNPTKCEQQDLTSFPKVYS